MLCPRTLLVLPDGHGVSHRRVSLQGVLGVRAPHRRYHRRWSSRSEVELPKQRPVKIWGLDYDLPGAARHDGIRNVAILWSKHP